MFSGYCSGGKMRAFVLNEYKSKKEPKNKSVEQFFSGSQR